MKFPNYVKVALVVNIKFRFLTGRNKVANVLIYVSTFDTLA